MYTGLSLDQAPPFKAVLKFFLTAPLFAVLAAIFTFFSNDLNMYSMQTIALVHLFTIGFMLMVIFGALQQMLPVVAGAVIPKANTVSNFTYSLMIIGILSFFIGFYFHKNIFLFISAFTLLLSIIVFIGICIYQLLKVKPKSMIVQGIIISLVFSLFAILVGIHLEISHARENLGSIYFILTTLHYNYIFIGFIFLLIVSITFQVVPMFWVTNAFSKSVQKFIIYFTTSILIVYTFLLFFGFETSFLYKLLLCFISIYFAIVTIKSITTRKRKLKDLSVYYYTTSMIFLILGSLYFLFMSFFELKVEILAILWGLGFITSIMNGMLYKIVPFLAWFHLSSKGFFDIPTIRDMIPLKHIEKQYYLHMISILLLILFFIFNIVLFLKIASVLFIASNLYLFYNLYKAAKVYLDFDTSQSQLI